MKAHASKVDTLFSAYCASPSSDLRDQLIRLHVGLARKVLHQTYGHLPGTNDCLEAIALQGLTHAVDAYSPRQRQPFSHFAIPYIRQALRTQIPASHCRLAGAGPVVVGAGETRLCS